MHPGSNICVPTSKGRSFLPLWNILRIESRSNYSRIYFADNSYPLTVARVLKWFEAQLPPGSFIRPHRTHLVNKACVQGVQQAGKLRWLCLHNGERIAISRRKQTAVGRITAAQQTGAFQQPV